MLWTFQIISLHGVTEVVTRGTCLSGSSPQSSVNGEVPGGEAGVERCMVKSESQLETFMKLWHQMKASWDKRSQWG